jgi:hypothetical protein
MRSAAASLVLVTACYASHPALPTIAVPALKDGATLEVESESHDTGHFRINYAGEIVKDINTTSWVTYGGEKLTFAQASALGDRAWPAKVARLRGKHRACSRARGPELVGYSAMAIGGLLGLVVGLKNQDNYSTTISTTDKLLLIGSLGSFGFGVASYLGGYAVGGYACAGEGEMRVALHIDDTSTTLSGHEADELGQVVKDFNARHRVGELRSR